MCWKSFEGRATQLTRCQLPTQSNAMQIKPGRAVHVRKLDNLKVEQHISKCFKNPPSNICTGVARDRSNGGGGQEDRGHDGGRRLQVIPPNNLKLFATHFSCFFKSCVRIELLYFVYS